MDRAVVLLPPSEGKADGGRRRGRARVPRSFPELAPARAEVARALRTAMADRDAAQRLLGVKGEALDAAVTANRALGDAPVRPAIERYTGVLYDHLDAAGLDAAGQDRLRRQVVIVSGLWGLVRPDDPLPDYKLKADAVLPPLGRLSTWWRPTLSPVLDSVAAGALVWDLLPGAHARVWRNPGATSALRVTVAFSAEQRRDGAVVRTSVTHWSKALKGALARHLLQAQPRPATRAAVGEVLDAFRSAQGHRLADLVGEGSQVRAELVAPLTPS